MIYPSLIWRMPAERKELYLTFDDGPVDGPTDFAIETLNRANAKATFFCIGDNIVKHSHVFKKITAHGHAVGNHTHNHINGWKTRTADYIRNIRLFEENFPADAILPTAFRPPYGRITPSQIRALQNYAIIMWDVISFDFSKNLSPDDCLKNTIKACRPGSIIVFHDSFKAEKNMSFTLPRLLEHFSSNGYAFRAIST